MVGQNKDTTIIYANPSEHALNVSSVNVSIKNFTIRNAGKSGIYAENTNNLTIDNCIIKNNVEYGVFFIASINGHKTQSNIVSNCTIFENGFSGIRITDESDIGGTTENITIIHCEFYKNGKTWTSYDKNATVSITPNQGMITNTIITDCLFYHSYSLDVYINGKTGSIFDNKFYNNNFLSNKLNVYDEGQNIWYNANSSKGNFWACHDDIAIPLNIPGGDNKDIYPLANPIGLLRPTAKTNGPYTAEVGEKITFSASKSTGNNLKFEWQLGNGQTKNEKTFSYAYPYPGTYTIELKVEDYYGLVDYDTTTATITAPDETSDPLPPIVNKPPIADAGGPYYEIVNVPVQFDGSDSYDPDGNTLTYKWEFGDGFKSNAKIPTHTYKKPGNYTVKLTVVDEADASAIDTTVAYITNKPNNPPERPIVKGDSFGSINVACNFSANSTDLDPDDMIQYVFNWTDGTNDTISDFLNSSEQFNVSHIFTTGGIYFINVYVLDENNAQSENQTFKIAINAHYCKSLGYLVDKDGDGFYDVFFREATGRQTDILQEDDTFFIDINGDDVWDYIYDFTADSILIYSAPDVISSEKPESQEIWIILIALICLAIIFIVVVKIAVNKTRKNKKVEIKNQDEKKQDKRKEALKEKKVNEIANVKSSEINYKEKTIEEEIDMILQKKK